MVVSFYQQQECTCSYKGVSRFYINHSYEKKKERHLMIIKQPSRAFPPNNYINGIFFKLALSDRSPHNSIIFIDCFQKIPEIAFMSAINNNFVQSIIKFSLPNYLPNLSAFCQLNLDLFFTQIIMTKSLKI